MTALPTPAIAAVAVTAPQAARTVATAADNFVELLRGALRGPKDAIRPPADGGIVPSQVAASDVHGDFERRLSQLADELRAALRAAGIELTAPVQLALDDYGRLQVSGEHPQAFDIDFLLEARPDLAQGFRSLAAAGRLAALEAGARPA